MDKDEIARRLEMLEAQVAGLVGAVAVLIHQTAEEGKDDVIHAVGVQLETLHAVLLGDAGRHSDIAIRAVENLRAALLQDSPSDT